MEYEVKSNQNEDEYVSRLVFSNSFTEDNDSTCVYVTENFEADISDRQSVLVYDTVTFSFSRHVAICKNAQHTRELGSAYDNVVWSMLWWQQSLLQNVSKN